mmetsp:Transcript_29484/g.28203  ORF Transcript_29484/g.28203 Transcript_29484/m.28203 type:complete len:219 (-) Transcript_29484:357-1013(-)
MANTEHWKISLMVPSWPLLNCSVMNRYVHTAILVFPMSNFQVYRGRVEDKTKEAPNKAERGTETSSRIGTRGLPLISTSPGIITNRTKVMVKGPTRGATRGGMTIETSNNINRIKTMEISRTMVTKGGKILKTSRINIKIKDSKTNILILRKDNTIEMDPDRGHKDIKASLTPIKVQVRTTRIRAPVSPLDINKTMIMGERSVRCLLLCTRPMGPPSL